LVNLSARPGEDHPLFIRLYTDEMVPTWFAEALRSEGYDAISALEVGMGAAEDEEHLALAAAQGRVLFTCNVADRHHNFVRIHKSWLAANRAHAGILLCPQEQVSRNASMVLQRLLRFLDRCAADEMVGQLRWLP
jgi:hypothetical protein